MDLLSIMLIGVGLSMDCFAVAIAGTISVKSLSLHHVIRTSLSFGFFQTGMLIVGWLVGNTVVDIIERYDHWVAFGLLFFVGSRMIWEFFVSDEDERKLSDITKGLPLITLSVATSIDSLAVGLSLAFLESGVLIAAVVVGSITFLITGAGFYFGKRIGSLFGRRVEVLGGIVLIGIGIRILLTELL